MKRAFMILALPMALALALGSAISVSAAPPMEFGGHYYQVVNSPGITWTAADAAASAATLDVAGLSYHGHLAVITSQAENSFIYGHLVMPSRAWIGGYQDPDQLTVGAGWHWVTGETMTYLNWDPTTVDSPIGSPNDSGGPFGPQYGFEDNAENYMEMRGQGYWDDLGNAPGFVPNYVIEFEAPTASIDIKPGSDPNSINLRSKGVVPVAILGSATFDVSTVDPSTVELAGAQAMVKGQSGQYGSLEDVNGDGYLDLVVRVSTQELDLAAGDTTASLTAETLSGIHFSGTDSVRIVQPKA